MGATRLETVLRRDRVVVAVSLAVIAVLAWAYVIWLAGRMGMPAPQGAADMAGTDMAGMDMSGMKASGMDMGAAMAPGFQAWTTADFTFTFSMWTVMMIGMMTPSVAPMLLLYAGVGRKANENGHPIASTAWFLAGYLAVWAGFSILATIAQWLLTRLALLNPAMVASSAVLGGAILIAAGLYQWTPMKGVCLRQCQAPIAFLASHGGFRSSPLGALRLGIAHGAYCLGCCWVLMALLFVGGVMNILWIAAIAFLVLLEKVVPAGQWISRISGTLMAVAGVWLLAGAF